MLCWYSKDPPCTQPGNYWDSSNREYSSSLGRFLPIFKLRWIRKQWIISTFSNEYQMRYEEKIIELSSAYIYNSETDMKTVFKCAQFEQFGDWKKSLGTNQVWCWYNNHSKSKTVFFHVCSETEYWNVVYRCALMYLSNLKGPALPELAQILIKQIYQRF